MTELNFPKEEARGSSLATRALGAFGQYRGKEPLIILAFSHGGAEALRSTLAHELDLAYTWSTGVLPLCRTATMVWRSVEGSRGAASSMLARKSVHALISAQISVILATTGKMQWCETAIAPTECAESFLEIFPSAKFICLYRSCTQVIAAGLQTGFGDTLMRENIYPGDQVNSLASYWAYRAESLLAFEFAHPDACQRLLYEDLEPSEADVVRHAASSLTGRLAPQLRERINSVLARLSYPPLP
jgi:protein-tyrosine sulfotransferase